MMHQRKLPLAYSCPESLDGMPRISEVERWCSVCRKSVHELSNMSESEALALLRAGQRQGRMCVNYRVDERGRVLFRDRPSPDRSRTTLALAGLALAITLAGGCVGFEHEVVTQPEDHAPAYWADEPFQPLRVEPEPPVPTRTSAAKATRLLVLVVDSSHDDKPIAGASVWIVGDSGSMEGSTSDEGTHRFDGLQAGTYTVEALAEDYVYAQSWIHVQADALSTLTLHMEPDLPVEPPPRRAKDQLTGVLVEMEDREAEQRRRAELLRLEAEAAAKAEAAEE